MKSIFKKTVVGINRSKFSVIAYRYIEYNSEGLFCSISGNSTGKEKFLLEKKGVEELYQMYVYCINNYPTFHIACRN